MLQQLHGFGSLSAVRTACLCICLPRQKWLLASLPPIFLSPPFFPDVMPVFSKTLEDAEGYWVEIWAQKHVEKLDNSGEKNIETSFAESGGCSGGIIIIKGPSEQYWMTWYCGRVAHRLLWHPAVALLASPMVLGAGKESWEVAGHEAEHEAAPHHVFPQAQKSWMLQQPNPPAP